MSCLLYMFYIFSLMNLAIIGMVSALRTDFDDSQLTVATILLCSQLTAIDRNRK